MIRAIIALGGVLAIIGCTPMSSPTQSVLLGQGEVIATTPEGYCFDNVASQTNRDFAILAPCASLGGDQGIPDVIGFATLQVGPPDSGSIVSDELALRDYLITKRGVSQLSQTGDADDVDILSTQAFNNQVMIHFTDAGPPPMSGLQNDRTLCNRSTRRRLL